MVMISTGSWNPGTPDNMPHDSEKARKIWNNPQKSRTRRSPTEQSTDHVEPRALARGDLTTHNRGQMPKHAWIFATARPCKKHALASLTSCGRLQKPPPPGGDV